MVRRATIKEQGPILYWVVLDRHSRHVRDACSQEEATAVAAKRPGEWRALPVRRTYERY
jgi:hypothetical protein